MDKVGENYFLNLLKATRIKRTLLILMVMLIPAAYSNKFPLTLLYLGLVAVLIYSAAGIHNAYKDKDYKLPQYSKKVILGIVLIALLLASLDKIILITSVIAIFLGYIYNTISRYIIFGDTFIAGLTHFVLPIIASSLLVGLSISTAFSLSILFYFLALCIGPTTNLKDIMEDKKRGYKTLVNSVNKPRTIAIILLNFSFIIVVLMYLFLGVKGLSLLWLIPAFLLELVTVKSIYESKLENALNLMRFYLITSFALLILILTSNKYLIFSSLSVLFIYFFTLLYGFRKLIFKRYKWNIMM